MYRKQKAYGNPKPKHRKFKQMQRLALMMSEFAKQLEYSAGLFGSMAELSQN